MEFNAKQQNELALFLQIQACLRVFPTVTSLPSSSFSRSSSRIPAHSPSIPSGISQSSEFASKTSKTDVSPAFWPISGIPEGARGDGALDAGRHGAFPPYRHFPPDALRCHFSLRFSEYLSDEGNFRGFC